MSTVKLPPLPDPHCGPNYHTDGLALFSDDQMQAYATKSQRMNPTRGNPPDYWQPRCVVWR